MVIIIIRRTRKKAYQVRALATNPDDPCFILRNHTVEGENWLPQVVYTHVSWCT